MENITDEHNANENTAVESGQVADPAVTGASDSVVGKKAAPATNSRRNSRRYAGFNERYKGKPSKPGNKQDAYGDPPPPVEPPSSPTVFLSDPDVTLWHGDVRATLAQLEAGSVDCVVTSPPYWGLRDYGTGAWEGGEPECDHMEDGRARRDSPGGFHNSTGDRSGETQPATVAARSSYRDVCGKCGATRTDQQLGLEPTPELYIENMVGVFREVWRVLADHGTCWVNMGDSYATTAPGSVVDPGAMAGKHVNEGAYRRAKTPSGLKPKDLVGVPWRLAFALQADGWYLRSDIVWSKPNPMPESVTDRPTKAHEYVFLLSKRPRYFFDQEAVREPHTTADRNGERRSYPAGSASSMNDGEHQEMRGPFAGLPLNAAGRNIRSVWEIATQPYPEAHFATFPEELARRCILAGTSERGKCAECGKPWVRMLEHGESDYARLKREGADWRDMDAAGLARGVITREGEGGQTRNPNGTVPSLRPAIRNALGWRPSCGCVHMPEVCHHDMEQQSQGCAVPDLRLPVPCVVLDPFVGSGTVPHVARKHGRHAIGVDLNGDYLKLAAKRLQQLSLLSEVNP